MVHILSVSIITVALVGGLGTSSAAIASGPTTRAAATVDSTIPDKPQTTANDFFPEERDVTDCIGTVERPGCGSKARGGWRQTLVFIAMFIGLFIVFGRVAVGVSRNRKKIDNSSTMRE
jgi:hypothetical protein